MKTLFCLVICTVMFTACRGDSTDNSMVMINCDQRVTVQMPLREYQELESTSPEGTVVPLATEDFGNGDVSVTASICQDLLSDHEVTTVETTATGEFNVNTP